MDIKNWITSKEEEIKNSWTLYRKNFEIKQIECSEYSLKILGDSRYYLYVNGQYLGMGPQRSYEFERFYDMYDIKKFLKNGENAVCVFINNFNTSTSQYIAGKEGLLAEIKLGNYLLSTDETWKIKKLNCYERNVMRINVSQPWGEIFDARKFEEEWLSPNFRDESWENAVKPKEKIDFKLSPRNIPQLTFDEKRPQRILSKKIIFNRKIFFSFDYKSNFYPMDKSTEDKLHTGFIVTNIFTEKECLATFQLLSRKWPLINEKIKINADEYNLPPDKNEIEIKLNKGNNLFLLDISGAYQRFNVDLSFYSKEELKFEMEVKNKKSEFASIGPFESYNIGNIVCMDGFSIDYNDANKISVWNSKSLDEVKSIKKANIQLLSEENSEENSVKLGFLTDEIVKELAIKSEDTNLLYNNSSCTEVNFSSEGEMSYIVDFGEEQSGFLKFEIESYKNVYLDFVFFENYFNREREIPIDLNNTLRYYCRDGRQEYLARIRRGFRYFEIKIRNLKESQTVKIYNIKLMESLYPMSLINKFECSNATLNKIFDMSVRSIQLCIEDTVVDCPGFEQAFWIGDARHVGLMMNNLFYPQELEKRGNLLVASGTNKSKYPECHLPAGLSLHLTAWGLFWILSCCDYYAYTKDKKNIEKIFANIKYYLDNYVAKINEDGLLEIDSWNLLDWAEMDTPYSGIITHQNGILAKVLDEVGKLSELMGDQNIAKEYQSIRLKLVASINKNLFNDEKGMFIDCIHKDGRRSEVISLQTNIILYNYDCIEENRKRRVEEYILGEKEHSFIDIGSPFAKFFQYEAWNKNKLNKKILDDIEKRWFEFFKYGSNTCWETFIGFYKERLTRSYCHGWSGVPAYFIPKVLFGINILKNGFEEIELVPDLKILEWYRGGIPTPYGNIEIEYIDSVLKIQYPKHINMRVVIDEKVKMILKKLD